MAGKQATGTTWSADSIAEQVGNSRGNVSGRLKASSSRRRALKIRKACLAGEIGRKVAQLIARLRTPKLQEKALGCVKAAGEAARPSICAPAALWKSWAVPRAESGRTRERASVSYSAAERERQVSSEAIGSRRACSRPAIVLRTTEFTARKRTFSRSSSKNS